MNLNYAKKEEKVTMIRNILKKTSYSVHEYLIFKDFFFDIVQKGDSHFDISPSFYSTFLKEQYHDQFIPDYRFVVGTIGGPFKIEFECGVDGCIFSILMGRFHHGSCFAKYLDPIFDSIVDLFLNILQLYANGEQELTVEYIEECATEAVDIATEAFNRLKEKTHE